MLIQRRALWGILCGLVVCTGSVWGAFDGYDLTIGNPDGESQETAPCFLGTMDAAGYSDWIFYGKSPDHDYGYHELLSGEWGAAIYYEGIDTDVTADPNDSPTSREAMWLTKDFAFPDWGTNSDFHKPADKICEAWHNPSNPVGLMNTGQSTIRNDEVEIRIDYEVVDMNSLGSTGSPMTFISNPNTGAVSHIFSDQYVFLQTYTIRNLKMEILNGLEFYQFLHGHGADEYGARVNSTYTDDSISDPLDSYIPVNSVHNTGSFRYDITQWNQRPFSTSTHIDYVGFSSTVEPNWIDNSYYEGGHSYDLYIPPRGTHLHIEDRNLNGETGIYTEEVGGAMGWSLGSLDPNETASLTVAFMFTVEKESPSFILTKTIEDPNDCYKPGDTFTYIIEWENIGLEDAENVVLIDYLPDGVDYPGAYWRLDPNMVLIPPDPNYDEENHRYTWDVGTIAASGTGYRELTVIVNERASSGMTIRNEVVLATSIGNAVARYTTDICCWDDSGVIYVDEDAAGANTGMNWNDAYTDLQDALARARADCWTSTEIRVARGVYDPGRIGTTVFSIPDNTSVYGGCRGGTVDGNDRDPKKYRTVLAGDRDVDRNETIVTMGDNTVLDGFTVTGAAISGDGIYGSGVDFTIENCSIEKNEGYGIRAEDGDVTIKWCQINNNDVHGILHQGEGFTLTIENSQIRKNDEYGVHCINSTPTIKNSIVSENDLAGAGRQGIRLVNPTYSPVLYNNTIAYNKAAGIFFVDTGTISDPNDRDWPDVQNCILWYNNDGGKQIAGFEQDVYASFCSIQDCNEVNTLNFNANPKFAYYDPDNVHLAYDSPCKDKGNPNLSYDDQVDMDSESRKVGEAVDVGADELFSCDGEYSEDDFHNALDWNADGVVNMYEFSKFSSAWLSHDPNDPVWIADPNLVDPNDVAAWSAKCNLDDTGSSEYAIDLADLVVFASETPWLWKACWRDNYIEMYGMMMGGGGEGMIESVGAGFEESSYESEEQSVYADMSESELALFVKGIYEMIELLEIWIEEDPEVAESAAEIIDHLEAMLLDIKEWMQ